MSYTYYTETQTRRIGYEYAHTYTLWPMADSGGSTSTEASEASAYSARNTHITYTYTQATQQIRQTLTYTIEWVDH